MGNNGSGDFLYAANFASGQIDVFNSAFAPASLAGNFTDPNLPSGFAPFNVKISAENFTSLMLSRTLAKHDDVSERVTALWMCSTSTETF